MLPIINKISFVKICLHEKKELNPQINILVYLNKLFEILIFSNDHNILASSFLLYFHSILCHLEFN